MFWMNKNNKKRKLKNTLKHCQQKQKIKSLALNHHTIRSSMQCLWPLISIVFVTFTPFHGCAWQAMHSKAQCVLFVFYFFFVLIRRRRRICDVVFIFALAPWNRLFIWLLTWYDDFFFFIFFLLNSCVYMCNCSELSEFL